MEGIILITGVLILASVVFEIFQASRVFEIFQASGGFEVFKRLGVLTSETPTYWAQAVAVLFTEMGVLASEITVLEVIKHFEEAAAKALSDEAAELSPAALDASAWVRTSSDHPLPAPQFLNGDESKKRPAISRIIREHYSKEIPIVFWTRSVRELECGSQNFCVYSLMPSRHYLLRFHRRVQNIDDIRNLQTIEAGMADSKVFPDGEALRPIRPLSPVQENALFVSSPTGNGRAEYAALYPFLDNVSRLQGSEQELSSLAECFGRVQTVLANNRQWPELSDGGSWLGEDISQLRAFFNDLQRRNFERLEEDIKPLVRLLLENAELVLESLDRSEELFKMLRSPQDQGQLVLHDLHPRNSFFRDGRCALIYDYENVTRRVTEVEAAAFCFHRHARKIVIAQKAAYPTPDARRPLLRRLVKAFVDNYNKGRGKVVLDPANFISILEPLIALPNLRKLLHFGDPVRSRTKDAAGRDTKVLGGELAKYISCLKEATEFDSRALSS